MQSNHNLNPLKQNICSYTGSFPKSNKLNKGKTDISLRKITFGELSFNINLQREKSC